VGKVARQLADEFLLFGERKADHRDLLGLAICEVWN
jgi:hypothetical protein